MTRSNEHELPPTGRSHDADREDATFLRAGLLLGILSGEAAVAWADRLIERDSETTAELLDLSLTPADDLSALRHALFPLADAVESAAVVRRILTIVANDFLTGRRRAEDTLHVLRQLRRLVAVPDEFKAPLTAIEQNHMLASAGVEGRLDAAEAQLNDWLRQFVE